MFTVSRASEDDLELAFEAREHLLEVVAVRIGKFNHALYYERGKV
jgi:hypothetical protein